MDCHRKSRYDSWRTRMGSLPQLRLHRRVPAQRFPFPLEVSKPLARGWV
jgi:hypothetical protein